MLKMTTKTHNLLIRVTDAESAMIKNTAMSLGLTQSSLVLSLVIKKAKSLQRKQKARSKKIEKSTSETVTTDMQFLGV